jgi:hypothetical protein
LSRTLRCGNRAVLEDHADPPVVRIDPGVFAGDRAAGDRDAARVRSLEAREQAQERGLAGAAWAEQRDQLAAIDVQGGAVDRSGEPERLAKAFGLDCPDSLRHYSV